MAPRIRSLWPYAAPLGFTVTTLLHPVVRGSVVEITDRTAVWLAVHVVQVVLIMGLGLTVRWLVDGLDGRAADVARGGAWVFVAVYAAFDAVVGVGTGVVVRAAATLEGAERTAVLAAADALFTHPLGLLLAVVGSLAWVTAAVSVALAHRRIGTGGDVTAAIAVAGLLLGLTHVGPPGLAGAFALLYAIQRIRGRDRGVQPARPAATTTAGISAAGARAASATANARRP